MLTLIADVETNGKRHRQPQSWRDEPFITQIAAKLVDGETVIGQFSSFFSRYDSEGNELFKMPKEKFFLDMGYTDSFFDQVGHDRRACMQMFNQFLKRAERAVFHNARFDWPVIVAEYMRQEATVPTLPVICTMLTLEPVLKLPGKYGYKWPTLQESYKKLVNPEGFSGAHDAMIDVTATHAVLQKIEQVPHPLAYTANEPLEATDANS